MAIQGQALADGQLANAEATIYTVPAGTVAYVKSIICQNTGAGANVVQLWVRNDGANSRRLIYVTLQTNEQLYFNEPLTMAAADLIRGAATNANEVDYVVNGAEET
jgi:hypothetical protein